MATSISYHTHPKIIEITLRCEFVPACKISVHSIYSFWRHGQFQSPMKRLTTPVSDHAQLKHFDQLLIYVNFYQHAKKSDYFIDLFWRYGWLNPAIWLAKNILAYTPRTIIFPNIRFVHEYSKQHKFPLQNKCSKN